MSSVAEHMARDLLVVAPATPVGEAAQRMAERNVGTVLVMDGDRLAGIFTERDLLRAVGAGYEADAPISAWMTANPETVDATDTIQLAATIMIHGGFRHLPVVEHGRVVGVLSIRDLVRVALVDSAPRGV